MKDLIFSPIDDYKVTLFGNSIDCENLLAYIYCYHNGKNIMICEFYRSGCKLPENRKEENKVVLSYPEKQFCTVIDMFRNERPLFFGYDQSTKVGYLSTQLEASDKEKRWFNW